MLAGPPPHTPPGTIGRQGNNPANARIVTGMHGLARKLGVSSTYLVLLIRRRCRSLAAMRHLVACACVALIANPGNVAAKPLQPTGKWVVDFGDSRCVAQRIYGETGKPVYLLIKASAVGEGLQLSVAQKGPNGYGVQEPAKLTMGKGEPIKLLQLRYGIEKKQVRTVNLTRAQMEQLASSTELRWDTANLDYSIPLGPMANLIKVVEKCRVGLGDYWNGTPEKKALLKQPVSMNTTIRKLFSSDDYPSQAVFGVQSGTAHIIALIDEKGQMADCMVVETSGIAVLDAQTCIIMHKRAKFSPAIGADGKPAKSTFTQRVRWEMP